VTKLGKAIGLGAMLAGFVAPPASAGIIDLRDPILGASYNNQHSFVVTGSEGIIVTFTSVPSSATFTYNNGGGTNVDGLGVNYGIFGQADEIETTERVRITFSAPVVISSIFVTDLFRESLGGHWYNEMGWYSVDGATPPAMFLAPDGNLPYPATNGELTVPIGMPVHESFVLSAPGFRWVGFHLENHEYSLGSITYAAVVQPPPPPPDPEPVPEPDTLLLFGASALAFAAAARSRSRRAFATATRSRSRRANL
jgi:PEP-CTERM motif-containing protein